MVKFIFMPDMGCSGDMVLGALADLGAEDSIAESIWLALGVKVRFRDSLKKGVKAKTVEVKSDEKCTPQRMVEIIRSAGDILQFDEPEMRFAWDTFETILEAERSVHGLEEVHLHEMGHIDTVVDIIGATAGLSELGAFQSEVLSTPVAVGKSPAPAAIRILKSRKFNFYTKDIAHELCTPTGASIMVNIAHKVCEAPDKKDYREGCGGGLSDFSLPNILRLRIL